MGHLGPHLLKVVVAAPTVSKGASRMRVFRGNLSCQNHPECQAGEACPPMPENS